MGSPGAACDGALSLRVEVTGAVQGVGFRPFAHRLAADLGLAGSVQNLSGGVRIDIEGEADRVRSFLSRLATEIPAGAQIDDVATSPRAARGTKRFEILESLSEGAPGPLPLDSAPCSECVAELFEPEARRHQYPFVSCAACGPRYSIVQALPYDRSRTSMRVFPMCSECQAEYLDPWDRRFHAQTNCCPACGPRVELWDATGRRLSRDAAALRQAGRAVLDGAVVALKGLGGFQLIVDAAAPQAVERLRTRKGRPEKPFALLVRDVEQARQLCRISAAELSTLRSAAAPIVLLERIPEGAGRVADGVAPENPDLGVMLPATPLHHLLLDEIGSPVVATSGNRSGDPICHMESQAVARLEGMADLFLVHDRPVVHPIDDSVVRVFRGQPCVLRAARGYAPISVPVPGARAGVVGWGAHLKNTVAVSARGRVRVSPHIGDLHSPDSRALAARTVEWLGRLEEPGATTCSAVDLHPESGQEPEQEVQVQHHYAHVLACMAEHDVSEPVLGIAWDGNGYGPDGTIWGGEFLVCDRRDFRRAAHLRTFPLPGAERAIREGRRAALGVLYELHGSGVLDDLDLAPVRSFRASERRTIARMLERGLNCPRTSSMGRLFDAIASLVDLRHKTGFEGQAAMALEFSSRGRRDAAAYPFPLVQSGSDRPLTADWGPLVEAVIRDARVGLTAGWISACFHETLAALTVAVAEREGLGRVVLTGGCFQNQRLLERAMDRLRNAGFDPLCHRHVPPNDGGVALGQVVHASTQPPMEV